MYRSIPVKSGELKAKSVTFAAETVVATVDTVDYGWLTLHFDYSKGDETQVDIKIYGLHTGGGTEYANTLWSESAGVYTREVEIYRLAATSKSQLTLDVRGKRLVKIYEDATGGTPDGTLGVGYTLKPQQ